ncbi:MAG: hypothetical protein O3A01_01170 [bacterium]|nr:hypothetical protein [bacterium]
MALLTLKHTPTGATTSPVAILENGGLLLHDYAVYRSPAGVAWHYYTDPFFFLNKALKLNDLPRPDITTINGKRIFFTHIDGDGFINPTYFDRGMMSGESIYKEILTRYPEIPFTVSVITSEIDPKYKGSADSHAMARRLFLLPNVEAATHTFSHPLIWDRTIIPDYTVDSYGREVRIKTFSNNALLSWRLPGYSFSPEAETIGSIHTINTQLLPEGKTARLVLWSGNTRPNETTLKVTSENGLLNMNGGDSRFDPTRPSYLGVSPFYRKLGNYYQIYSANANENLYTDLWSKQFGAFKNVIQTFENTESPKRVSAMNAYYHFYSGERRSSLQALHVIYNYALKSDAFMVYASRYVQTVNGFISTKIDRISPSKWRVWDTGELRTIRFDSTMNVDLPASTGVIGFTHINDALYVHLDASDIHTIALTDAAPQSTYLISANHDVSIIKNKPNMLEFRASNLGEMVGEWGGFLPNKNYSVRWTGNVNGTLVSRSDAFGRVAYRVPATGNVDVRIQTL